MRVSVAQRHMVQGTIKLGFREIVFKFAGCEENETVNNYGGKQ